LDSRINHIIRCYGTVNASSWQASLLGARRWLIHRIIRRHRNIGSRLGQLAVTLPALALAVEASVSLSPPFPPAPSSSPPTRHRRPRRLVAGLAALLAATSGMVIAGAQASAQASTTSSTTAWHDGSFDLNPDGVVSRDDIVLGAPNINPAQSIPMGNGAL